MWVTENPAEVQQSLPLFVTPKLHQNECVCVCVWGGGGNYKGHLCIYGCQVQMSSAARQNKGEKRKNILY